MAKIEYFPSVKDIEKAEEILGEILEPTPIIKNPNLSEKYESEIFLKREDLQMVRSYKIRGAYNKIRSISPETLKYGIVCTFACCSKDMDFRDFWIPGQDKPESLCLVIVFLFCLVYNNIAVLFSE